MDAATTVNLRDTVKAGKSANKAPAKRSTRKVAGNKQTQDAGTPLAESLGKARGHLNGSATQDGNKQSEGAGTSGKEASTRAPRKPRRASLPMDAQQDGAGQAGNGGDKQGEASAGEVRLGTLQVLVVNRKVPPRGGKTCATEEKWPFVELGLSTETGGEMEGPSFFIPMSQHPATVLTAGRKRLRGQEVSIISRKVYANEAKDMGLGEEEGYLVWKIAGAGR